MFDSPKTVSLNVVAASLLWALVVACMIAMLVLAEHPDQRLIWGTLGCPLSAGAATLSIRGYFIRFAKRERDAFALGREVGRSEDADVRRLR